MVRRWLGCREWGSAGRGARGRRRREAEADGAATSVGAGAVHRGGICKGRTNIGTTWRGSRGSIA